jgi:hypothetical protein
MWAFLNEFKQMQYLAIIYMLLNRTFPGHMRMSPTGPSPAYQNVPCLPESHPDKRTGFQNPRKQEDKPPIPWSTDCTWTLAAILRVKISSFVELARCEALLSPSDTNL